MSKLRVATIGSFVGGLPSYSSTAFAIHGGMMLEAAINRSAAPKVDQYQHPA
jgi:hypothetical protein